MLPGYCTACNNIVNTDIIKDAQKMQSNEGLSMSTKLIIECSHCYLQFNHSPRFTKGDSRNVALLGHWDGFNHLMHHLDIVVLSLIVVAIAITNVCICIQYIIGAIEVQMATMAKRNRSRVEEVCVCGFVHSYALPNKMFWSLDPFSSCCRS